jgi:hypothetical protein
MNPLFKERYIMVRADDAHVITDRDDVDERCFTHHGATVMAPNLAANVPGAVGKLAREFNSVGRQVWTQRLMVIHNHKIVSRNPIRLETDETLTARGPVEAEAQTRPSLDSARGQFTSTAEAA